MIRHFLATWKHRLWVNLYLIRVCLKLLIRGQVHDLSKYGPHERRRFARALPMLAGSTYGSDEYERGKAMLGPALEHHYLVNRHHPEHWDEGVREMDLYDFIEMWCDWQAAVRRHDDGDLRDSIRQNADEYELDRQVIHLLANTAAVDGH